ncbi:MAG: alkaline phosphatase family protein [Microthrixaceae bacterium]|nr:alkaline phosphatase family protein [Microthrixaceae bacterium]
MARPGNVLFITVDQWRGDSLSCVGHPLVKTPNLDALAADGVLFARHFANTAPCGPSRASLYTGMYAHNHRSILNGTPLDARFTNIALLARDAGYEPALFGYTDTSVDPRTVEPDDPRLRTYEGVLPGFDPIVNDPEVYGSQQWAAWLAEQGVDVPDDVTDLYRPIENFPGTAEHGATWAPTRFAAEHTETAFMVSKLIEWLDERTADEWADDPFFVHASFIRPHPPYRNPVGYHDRYDADDIPPFTGHADRDDEIAAHILAEIAIQIPEVGAPENDRDRRQLRATYHGMQAEVDDQLGRLFAHLGDRGLDRNTLIVITSDHGEMGGDHWLTEKLGYWDESYHIPLIVRDPSPAADATRGLQVHEFTESVDVLPTVLGWIGVDVPDQCDGRALTKFLTDGTAPEFWRDAVFWEWAFSDPESRTIESLFDAVAEECSLTVVRSKDWKYVEFAGTSDQTPPLLFDLNDDPQQLVNLADDPAHASQVIDALRRIVQWRMHHNDRTLSTYHLSEEQGLIHIADPRR